MLLFSGVASRGSDFSSQGWFIGTMCAVALLTLVVLMICFVRKNKGGKYAGTPPPPQRQDMLSMEKGQLVGFLRHSAWGRESGCCFFLFGLDSNLHPHACGIACRPSRSPRSTLLVLLGTAVCIPCQATQVRISWLCSSTPHHSPVQTIPGSSLASLCCLVSEPDSVSQWFVPAKHLFNLFLSSQPAFPSSRHRTPPLCLQ